MNGVGLPYEAVKSLDFIPSRGPTIILMQTMPCARIGLSNNRLLPTKTTALILSDERRQSQDEQAQEERRFSLNFPTRAVSDPPNA